MESMGRRVTKKGSSDTARVASATNARTITRLHFRQLGDAFVLQPRLDRQAFYPAQEMSFRVPCRAGKLEYLHSFRKMFQEGRQLLARQMHAEADVSAMTE